MTLFSKNMSTPGKGVDILLFLTFGKLHHIAHLFHDLVIVFAAVRFCTATAILDAVFCIDKATAAAVPQGIQGAITKQAAEILTIHPFMAGEVFTFLILKILVVFHISYTSVQG